MKHMTIIAFSLLFSLQPLSAQQIKKVVCSTFPIYQITRNVTKNCQAFKISLMLPSQLGCPHDYILTPQDMSRLAKADVLVINGLGMEEFLGKIVKQHGKQLPIIDSSAGIKGTINVNGPHTCSAHCHDHAHKKATKNPHLFTSPSMRTKLAMNIATELARIVPSEKKRLMQNAATYAAKMNALAKKMQVLGKTLKNSRIAQQQGTFDYLARDMGLTIVATLQTHGQEPSAAELFKLMKSFKKNKAAIILTQPQYPSRIAKILGKETGIPVAVLDPGATGPANAPLNYYETIMKNNMHALKQILAPPKKTENK